MLSAMGELGLGFSDILFRSAMDLWGLSWSPMISIGYFAINHFFRLVRAHGWR